MGGHLRIHGRGLHAAVPLRAGPVCGGRRPADHINHRHSHQRRRHAGACVVAVCVCAGRVRASARGGVWSDGGIGMRAIPQGAGAGCGWTERRPADRNLGSQCAQSTTCIAGRLGLAWLTPLPRRGWVLSVRRRDPCMHGRERRVWRCVWCNAGRRRHWPAYETRTQGLTDCTHRMHNMHRAAGAPALEAWRRPPRQWRAAAACLLTAGAMCRTCHVRAGGSRSVGLARVSWRAPHASPTSAP